MLSHLWTWLKAAQGFMSLLAVAWGVGSNFNKEVPALRASVGLQHLFAQLSASQRSGRQYFQEFSNPKHPYRPLIRNPYGPIIHKTGAHTSEPLQEARPIANPLALSSASILSRGCNETGDASVITDTGLPIRNLN